MRDGPSLGLVVLTGGQGQRLGGPKHDRPHPAGGTWGGHLVRVFRQVAPEGPVVLLGAPLPDAPACRPVEDPQQGPAVALRMWASSHPEPVHRWWVVACDQVAWTEAALRAWWREAERCDPGGDHWVIGRVAGQVQPLGGFLGGALVPWLAQAEGRAMRDLLNQLPCIEREGPRASGLDIDTPDDWKAWKEG